ncbi:MAG: CoB--CoM heterodisulfide reductase iron-sulfur subunit A family protein [candidate division WOR-3 bacterium]
MGKNKTGAVLVIGGGIGGVQAALDLADSGFKVFLVEKSPSIGGVMAQLDKTFPTNDCSMCILAPKLVSAGRHPNIELITYSEIQDLKGEPGDFLVRILRKSPFVNWNNCNGCGICWEKCPIKVKSEFDCGLGTRKAIYVPFPQSVPNKAVIDREHCTYFLKNGKCRVCQILCPAKAVDFNLPDKMIEINVGSIIIGTGLKHFEPHLKSIYGYGRYLNVIKSIELERILNASGPFQGHLLRPSDKKEPQRVAFIQCVGSRDTKSGSAYCSSVCCVYAIKEAILMKEHNPSLDCTIFYMDIRTFGKGFESYYKRAKERYRIKFRRAMIGEIIELKDSKNLLLRYEDEEGKLKKEEFDMVILSVGLKPDDNVKKLAEILHIDLNEFNLFQTLSFSTVETVRPGIFVCGTASSPKDIPETVTEASGAAQKAIELIKDQRYTLTKKIEYPQEIDISNQSPRIGVFVCHCGVNIAAVVSVKDVVEYAKTLPNVVYAEDNLYSCSDDSQQHIKEMIEKNRLNRIVVAACTPRTHEPLFQETIREMGLNKFLLEFTNIRDQCSWVHSQEPEAATEKAKDLVRMACARAIFLEPLPTVTIPVIQSGLVIGGGICGMNAALALANQDYKVYLVEREKELGGNARQIKRMIDGRDVQDYLEKLIKCVESHPGVVVYKDCEIETINGYIGNFKTTIVDKNKKKFEIDHGVIIVATGAREYEPTEYFYRQDPRIITQKELEQRLSANQTFGVSDYKTIVMIQCIGSRDQERNYCSRICCSQAIKNALNLLEVDPEANIYILYKDIRTYGFKEELYRKAREKGIVFIRYDDSSKPELQIRDGRLNISVFEPILKERLDIKTDLVVLSTGIVPEEENPALAKMLKVPLNGDGFFLEAHVKLRPVDFATEGIFVAGMAHSPMTIAEAIGQGQAAAARATTILANKKYYAEATVSVVNEELCAGCGMCGALCPYEAIGYKEKDSKRISSVNEALCKGCGTCVASCPSGAMNQYGFTKKQIMAMLEAI